MKHFIIITLLLVTFASCSNQKSNEKIELAAKSDTISAQIAVTGMTCNHCEMNVEKAVSELPGIITVKANHNDSTVSISYDPSKSHIKQVQKQITSLGYKTQN